MSYSIFGDSLAIGWAGFMQPRPLHHRAIGGSKVLSDPEHQMLEWSPAGQRPNLWDTVVLTKLPTKAVIISLGRNDLHLSVPPGGPFGIPPYAFRSHMVALYDGLLDRGYERVIWLQLDNGPSNRTREACADVYRDIISSIAGDDAVPLHKLLRDKHFGPDGVHHSEQGYLYIADILSGWIA